MKKRSKVILSVFLAILLSIPMIVFAATQDNQDHDSYDYTASQNLIEEHCCTSSFHAEMKAPVFIDPHTGDEWIGVDSRLCEHGMWGLDILYYFEGEERWVCHGSFDMQSYTFLGSTFGAGEHMEIAPLAWIACPRPNCNGHASESWMFVTQGRIDDRRCTKLPWGVDILYRTTYAVSTNCNSCGSYWGTRLVHSSQWRCYGF